MKQMNSFALVCALLISVFVAACSSDDNNPTLPTADAEIVQCTTTINGGTTHDGSKLIFASFSKAPSAQDKDAFIIMGYATTDISPKTRVDDGITIRLSAVTGVGSYKVSYPFGSIFGLALNGKSYISLQGTITVTRYDDVNGWVEGTFEGQANSEDGSVSITVTKGVFKVKRDADGLFG